MGRDTRTGWVLETMILPSLQKGGYIYETQKLIGTRLNGRSHKVDVAATDKSQRIYLISLKWQQVSGTAEQKIPLEVMCLIDAVQKSEGIYHHAYLVLGGIRWTWKDYYLSGDMNRFIPYKEFVTILTVEDFVARANKSKL